MIVETRPLTEITQEALRLLYRDLGIVNTIRFLNQFMAGYGDYTAERRAMIENQTLDDALADVYAFQSTRTSSQRAG